jgi:hypothetical protein
VLLRGNPREASIDLGTPGNVPQDDVTLAEAPSETGDDVEGSPEQEE